jgi:hypothetical protein
MPKRSRKLPRDMNQLGKAIVDIATGNAPPEPESTKNPHAVALGRKGGLIGGKVRAANMTKRQRHGGERNNGEPEATQEAPRKDRTTTVSDSSLVMRPRSGRNWRCNVCNADRGQGDDSRGAA